MYRPHILSLLVVLAGAAQATPQYQIYDLGVARSGDTSSNGRGISSNGIVVGRTSGTGSSAMKWTSTGGTFPLANPTSPARAFCVGNGVNSSGNVAGSGATTIFGSSMLPIVWSSGVPTFLPLPAGEFSGTGWGINNAGVVVGSCNSGTDEKGLIWQNGAVSLLPPSAGGQTWLTGYAISGSGIVVGQGKDPAQPNSTIGMRHDLATGITASIGALTAFNHNSAIAHGVSEAGHIVGTSWRGGVGDFRPFIWTPAGGMVQVAPAGIGGGRALGVNSAGWVVGVTDDGQAFLFDGVSSYLMSSLIPAGTGWNFAAITNYWGAAGISEDGTITGTAVLNGTTRGYVAILQSPVSGTVNLLEYNPTQLGLPVSFEVRGLDNSLLQSGTVAIGAGGTITFNLLPSLRGQNGKVFVRASHWLRKQVYSGVFSPAGIQFGSVSLTNGDSNADNVIDLTDYTTIVVTFNAVPSSGNWDPSADLNGDGVVDLSDYTTLVTNFNLAGD
ncbi:MAG: hypothetical protein K8R88_12580 [Armatimonadetes bacterium]|nr:hypothetical protein [Armatimonadota bacterium]